MVRPLAPLALLRQLDPTAGPQIPDVQRNLAGSSDNNSQTTLLYTILSLPLNSIHHCTPDILEAVCLCPCHTSKWDCVHDDGYP